MRQDYQNLSGNSGASWFAVADDRQSIQIGFRSGRSYTYDGPEVPTLIELAQRGSGLCTWINQNLRPASQRKLRERQLLDLERRRERDAALLDLGRVLFGPRR